MKAKTLPNSPYYHASLVHYSSSGTENLEGPRLAPEGFSFRPRGTFFVPTVVRFGTSTTPSRISSEPADQVEADTTVPMTWQELGARFQLREMAVYEDDGLTDGPLL